MPQEFQGKEDLGDAYRMDPEADAEDGKKIPAAIVIELKNIVLDIQNIRPPSESDARIPEARFGGV